MTFETQRAAVPVRRNRGSFLLLDARNFARALPLAKINAMKFLVNLDRDETGMIVAECPAIPGCISQGPTEREALENISEAIQACLEARAANGMPLTVAIRELEVSI